VRGAVATLTEPHGGGARLLNESRELLGQLGQLQATWAALERWRVAAVVLVLAWLATLVWLLLGR
jgi:hypothetical protein